MRLSRGVKQSSSTTALALDEMAAPARQRGALVKVLTMAACWAAAIPERRHRPQRVGSGEPVSNKDIKRPGLGGGNTPTHPVTKQVDCGGAQRRSSHRHFTCGVPKRSHMKNPMPQPTE